MEIFGEETWFKIGDRDAATHLIRTNMLKNGKNLSDITKWMCEKFAVEVKVIPVTDNSIETRITTNKGDLHLQEFWVKYRGKDKVEGIQYIGADKARPNPEAINAIHDSEMVIIAPGNPLTSIGPMLSIKGVRKELSKMKKKVVAVSPLIGNKAFSGPTVLYMEAAGIEKLSSEKEITETSEFISKKASQLIDAKPAKNEKATVVMNPDFVALLTHEILGHPSEADRVLGKEMAWAGGAWWAGKLNEKIGSEYLNVFDDPTIEGTLGCYQYDDEGNKASRTNLVEKGVLSNHMQSRETAQKFHTKPSANMRATSYRYMPLIRMACTCIDKGDWKPEEMISEVKNGYLISNMKIPSIDMKRYNWSISCQFAQKIENGEVTDLLRDVIVLGTAPDFFRSIDACGNDFTVRPITNCGKGDPMQSMVMGNGGPSIRASATVRSV